MHKFIIELPRGRIKSYEKLAIISEEPDFLIPMSFTELNEKDRIVYDYSGFIPMGQLNMCMGIRDVLDIVEEVLFIFQKASDCLIFPERISLNMDTVYVNREKRRVKLLFLPPEEDNNVALSFINLLAEFRKLYITREAEEYLEIIREYAERNYSSFDMANKIGAIKREAFICGLD